MNTERLDEGAAIERTRTFANPECVGQFSESSDIEQEDTVWVVHGTTHTYADEYQHHVRINHGGNVFCHEHVSRFA